jgi:GT2 family glycosyltransferase
MVRPVIAPSISIIIATKGRQKGLKTLFESLWKLEGLRELQPEIIVVNNADDGAAEQTVTALVEEFQNPLGSIRCIREKNGSSPRPKCRGQNFGIREAQGSILTFIDDDVEVTPGWLRVVHDFFLRHPYDAMQGAILVPPAFQEDKEFLKVWNRYRTIPYINYGSEVMEIHTLTGPNMAIKRQVFDRVGLFDERLGPGRSGMSEDVEFAQRMLSAGKRIGYEPKAAVYHGVDWDRLNEKFFQHWHEQQGRSRLIYKNNSSITIVPNLMRSLFSYGWHSIFSNERKKYRSLGRSYHYLAMLKSKLGIFGLSV